MRRMLIDEDETIRMFECDVRPAELEKLRNIRLLIRSWLLRIGSHDWGRIGAEETAGWHRTRRQGDCFVDRCSAVNGRLVTRLEIASAERCRCIEGSERAPNCSLYRSLNGPLLEKTNLRFRRMNVHVDCCRGKCYGQEHRGT